YTTLFRSQLDMRLKCFRIDQAALSPDHIGDRHLVPARVWPANHATFGDIRMLEQHALDLGWIDVFPARNDQILLAVVNPEVTVGIAATDIAAAIPAIIQRLARRVFIFPVFAKDVRPAHCNLSRRFRRQLVSMIVDDGSLTAETR